MWKGSSPPVTHLRAKRKSILANSHQSCLLLLTTPNSVLPVYPLEQTASEGPKNKRVNPPKRPLAAPRPPNKLAGFPCEEAKQLEFVPDGLQVEL